jgi:ABC-type lipoprotein release transport system permease subunit
MLLLRLALRNAVRSPARTGLTALTLVLGTALLTVAMSWLQGVFESTLSKAAEPVGHVRVVDPDYARREALFPLYQNLPDSEPIEQSIERLVGVMAVDARIVAPVTLALDGSDAELGDVLGLAIGAPDAWFRQRLGLADALSAGRLMEADDEVVLGATVAGRVGARVGDAVVVLGSTQDGSLAPLRARVVGVVSTGTATVDQGVFLPLEKMRWMADIPGGATELLVYGSDRDDAGALAARVREVVPPELAVEAWDAREPWAALLGLIRLVRGILEAIIVFVTALGVWNTMMMSVLERRAEIGVLRAMGLGKAGAVALFVVEAVGIAVLGGLVGVGLGGLASLWLESNGLELGSRITQNLPIHVATRVYADFDLGIAVTAFALGLVTAVIGSAAPALRAASVQPVDAIRS